MSVSESRTTAPNGPRSGVLRPLPFAAGLAAVVVLSGGLSACGASSNEIAGNWMPDDGSNVKTISDSGECTGMYYNGSKPLDIGGGMTCEFSKNADGEGMHTMVVSQPPNEETLRLKFVDADVVDVYSGGTKLFTMKRQ